MTGKPQSINHGILPTKTVENWPQLASTVTKPSEEKSVDGIWAGKPQLINHGVLPQQTVENWPKVASTVSKPSDDQSVDGMQESQRKAVRRKTRGKTISLDEWLRK